MSQSSASAMRDLTMSASAAGIGASFSQLGEDRVLWWIFEQRHAGFYVDIGCHQPYRFSNTALLHIANGWRGINVDVDERSIAAFREARPNDVNVCAAVGGEVSQLEVTMFQAGELNTFDPTMAANPARAKLILEKRLVDVLPLRDILREHVSPGQKIDFLNVDIEGLDHVALASNDWDQFVPEVIAVEVHGFNAADPTSSPTFRLLTSKGYRLLAHLVVTSIYRKEV